MSTIFIKVLVTFKSFGDLLEVNKGRWIKKAYPISGETIQRQVLP